MGNTAFLFCRDYFDHARPDADFAAEHNCVAERGGLALLFDFDAFLASGRLAVQAAEQPRTLLYRGWMLRAEQYDELYRALRAKGYTLINSPAQYRECHHLPGWYGKLREHTAASVWTEGVPDGPGIADLLRRAGGGALIVKDYVKSRKHEWSEACHIPDAADAERAARVVDTFVGRQEADLVGGVVLREYLPLQMIGTHPESGMPLAREVRVFCLRHTPFAVIQYWSGDAGELSAEASRLVEYCRVLDSNFYTVDLACRADGRWVIMEVGDGQVSGLQDGDAARCYDNLFKLLE